MPNWAAIPEEILEATMGFSPERAIDAITTTVLAHEDGCECTLCVWWRSDTPEPEVHEPGCLGNHRGDCAVSGLFQ